MAFDAQQGTNVIDMGFHKLPGLNVSSMKYLSGNFRFIVTLNQFTFGFKSVSGLSVSRELRTIEEGGVNDHGILVGQPDNSSHSLRFSRGLMLRFPEIADKLAVAAAVRIPNASARFMALMTAAGASPQETLERGPALGMVIAYDRNGNVRGKYSFVSFGITEWSVSDLDATDSSGILIEDLTIAHSGLVREPVTVVPASIVSVGSISGESQAEINARRAEEKLNYQNMRKKWAEKLGDLEKAKEDKAKELEKVNELKEKLAKGELDEAAIDALSDVSDDVKNMLKKSLKDKEIRDELDEYTKNLEEEKSWKAEDAKKSAKEQADKNAEIREKQISENTKENYEKARDERKAQIEEQNQKRAEEREASENAKAEKSEQNKELVSQAAEREKENKSKREAVEAVKAEKAEENKKYLESTKEDREKAQKKADEMREKYAQQAQKQAEKDKEVRKNLDEYTDALNDKKDQKAQEQQKLADAQNEQYQKNREESLKND
ncbi:MAG: phage tail protein [Acutalibacteraceae bacterium]